MNLTPIPPLHPDQERALVVAAKAGDQDALATLVRSQLRSLRSDARKYAAAEPTIDPEDLVSAGIEALMDAVATFDPYWGTRLWTHARASIAEAMADEVALTGRVIAVSGRTVRKYRRAIRETDTLESARNLARDRDGMAPGTFDAVHFALTGARSLDETFDSPDRENADVAVVDSETTTLGSRGPSPEGTAVSRALAKEAIAALDPRQKAVVTLAYLTDSLSDAQIAATLGLSRPTVTRTRNAALQIMRDQIA